MGLLGAAEDISLEDHAGGGLALPNTNAPILTAWLASVGNRDHMSHYSRGINNLWRERE